MLRLDEGNDAPNEPMTSRSASEDGRRDEDAEGGGEEEEYEETEEYRENEEEYGEE